MTGRSAHPPVIAVALPGNLNRHLANGVVASKIGHFFCSVVMASDVSACNLLLDYCDLFCLRRFIAINDPTDAQTNPNDAKPGFGCHAGCCAAALVAPFDIHFGKSRIAADRLLDRPAVYVPVSYTHLTLPTILRV